MIPVVGKLEQASLLSQSRELVSQAVDQHDAHAFRFTSDEIAAMAKHLNSDSRTFHKEV